LEFKKKLTKYKMKSIPIIVIVILVIAIVVGVYIKFFGGNLSDLNPGFIPPPAYVYPPINPVANLSPQDQALGKYW